VLAFLIVLLIRCDKKPKLNYFGKYGLVQSENLNLVLSIDNNFKVVLIDSIGDDSDLFTENVLYSGTIETSNTYLILKNQDQRTLAKLKRISEEKLYIESTSMVGVFEPEEARTLYCYTKFYSNGNVKWSGGWCNGSKCGLWFYYDENANELKREDYKYGSVRETVN
jgi:antitoxin component YwqK of YwqJK toxin-antitoxin module